MYHCFFRRHVCLSNLKHALPLTARKTVFSHLNKVLEKLWPQLYRPLPNSKNIQFENEAKCTAFLLKMSFICMRMKNHFHTKGWALNLVLIKRPGETRKWLIRLRWKFVLIRVTMTWELSWQRNDATTYFTCSRISRHRELLFQNRSRELFL